jgi:hypothetical protein
LVRGVSWELQKVAHSLGGIGDASKFNLLDLDLAAHDLSGMPRRPQKPPPPR